MATQDANAYPNEDFVYDGLDPDSRLIRVVDIEPGEWADPIKCNLRTVSLGVAKGSSEVAYQALSYVWGDWEGAKTISLDGRNFCTTQNLWVALRRLRLPRQPKTMWIDAICINQADKEEKSHQVGMMGEIYQACDEAVLWLGEGPDLVESGQRPPPSRVPRLAFEAFGMLGADKHLYEVELCTLNEEGELVISPKYEDHVKALETLFTRPWWKRIWIAQEAVLPIKAVFIYGSESASFDILRMAYARFQKQLDDCPSCLVSCIALFSDFNCWGTIMMNFNSNVGAILNAHDEFRSAQVLTLEALRLRFCSSLATDPHDHVYGLLGLLVDSPKVKKVEPNYSIPVSTAFQQAFRSTIFDDGDLFWTCGKRQRNRRVWTPSWMPDWLVTSVSQETKSLMLSYGTYSLFSASGCIAGNPIFVEEHAILVEAVPVDRIHSVMPNLDVGKLLEARLDFAGVAVLPRHIPARGSIEDQLWRSMKNDLTADIALSEAQRRVQDSDYEPFYSWWMAFQPNQINKKDPDEIFTYIRIFHQRMFLTKDGSMGAGFTQIQPGDEVCVDRWQSAFRHPPTSSPGYRPTLSKFSPCASIYCYWRMLSLRHNGWRGP